MTQVVERQARDLEAQDSNPGPSSNFSLEFKGQPIQAIQHDEPLWPPLLLKAR